MWACFNNHSSGEGGDGHIPWGERFSNITRQQLPGTRQLRNRCTQPLHLKYGIMENDLTHSEKEVRMSEILIIKSSFIVEAMNNPKSKARYAVFKPGDIFTAVIRMGCNLIREYKANIELYQGDLSLDDLEEAERICELRVSDFYNAFRDPEEDCGYRHTPPVYYVKNLE